jgi:prepilin-type N-terminal cleavage/methylation domain-containing protein
MKRGFTIWEFLIVLALVCIFAAILLPIFARSRENAKKHSCQSNLKMIGLGFRQYTQDYNEKYPPVTGGTLSEGWAVQLQPYLKSDQIFQCPDEETEGDSDPASNGYTDYWYNSTLAGKSEASVEYVALTVLSGNGSSRNSTYAFAGGGEMKDDGTAASPGTVPGKAVAPDQDEGGRFGLRKLDGVNYAFADRHVKWIKSGSATELNKVWNGVTPYTTSRQEPTFYSGKDIVVKRPKEARKPATKQEPR